VQRQFVKDFQQDIIAEMELITGIDMSKKALPKTLAQEIEKRSKSVQNKMTNQYY
jgi:hypothetical protein